MWVSKHVLSSVCAMVLGGALWASGARAAEFEEPGPEPAATTVAEEEGEAYEEPPAKIYGDKLIDIGLKLGASLNVFNSLGPAFSPELEIGFLLPPLEQAFEIFLSGRWAAPSDEGEMEPDARLPGDGVASWSVVRNELSLGLGLRFRIPVEGEFTPYVAAGARLYLLETEVEGDADEQPFGKNRETGTAFGFLFQLGGEYELGPGAILLELAINGAALDQTILADTNVSSFDIYLGYRFFL